MSIKNSNMIKYILLIGFSLLIITMFNGPAYSQNKLTSKQDINSMLAFTNAEYNMGKIPFGKSSEYVITIENISKDSIVLKNVAPQCGCTSPKYKVGEVILPGSSTTVTLGFNGNSKGAFSKHATISFGNGMIKDVKFNGETYVQ